MLYLKSKTKSIQFIVKMMKPYKFVRKHLILNNNNLINNLKSNKNPKMFVAL